MPYEIAETIIANALLNAVQHGGVGTVEIEIDDSGLTVTNPLREFGSERGFGLGLKVACRLAERVEWRIETAQSEHFYKTMIIQSTG